MDTELIQIERRILKRLDELKSEMSSLVKQIEDIQYRFMKNEEKHLIENNGDISVRTYYVLKNAGLIYWEELREKNLKYLKSLRNCGRRTIWEIEDTMNDFGLSLKKEV